MVFDHIYTSYMQASENANPKKAKSHSDTLLFGHTQKKTKLYNKN